MHNTAFSCVIMNDTVILIYQLFTAAVSGGSNGRFAFSSADYFYTTMIYCYKKSLPFGQ
jgi:hypothetical protein